jgi:hypothetical protein
MAMELTYEELTAWFDDYFEHVRRCQGNLETVPDLRRFFASNLQLTMHTPPSKTPTVMSRDALLVSFIHPGLQEDILPKCYAIDLRQLIVAVQFEIQFHDGPTGKRWAPIQASAHYHLTEEAARGLLIRRIEYWTELLPPEVFEIWAQRRSEALTRLAMNHLNAPDSLQST